MNERVNRSFASAISAGNGHRVKNGANSNGLPFGTHVGGDEKFSLRIAGRVMATGYPDRESIQALKR